MGWDNESPCLSCPSTPHSEPPCAVSAGARDVALSKQALSCLHRNTEMFKGFSKCAPSNLADPWFYLQHALPSCRPLPACGWMAFLLLSSLEAALILRSGHPPGVLLFTPPMQFIPVQMAAPFGCQSSGRGPWLLGPLHGLGGDQQWHSLPGMLSWCAVSSGLHFYFMGKPFHNSVCLQNCIG